MADSVQSEGVIISLENPLLSKETLENTPSMKDGLDRETEFGLRWHGCKLIQYSCLLLKLPAATLVTGQVLFQRYFYSKSFVRCKLDVAALACIWLASKVEESPRRLRNITNVLLRIRQIRRGVEPKPILVDDLYYQTKKDLINIERKILKELGFSVHVNHPYKYLFYISNWLQLTSNKEVLQGAWNYMNDSLMTDLYVRYHPKIIVCACLHLSARIFGVSLPQEPAWYEIFSLQPEEMEQICFTILELYSKEPENIDVLEERCAEVKRQIDARRALEKKVLAEKYKHLTASHSPAPSTDNSTQDANFPTPTPDQQTRPQSDVENLQESSTEQQNHCKESKDDHDGFGERPRKRSLEDDSNYSKEDRRRRSRERERKRDIERDSRRHRDDDRRRYRDEDYENHSRSRRHSRSRSRDRDRRREHRDRDYKSSRYDEDSRSRIKSSNKYEDEKRSRYRD